ncbi:MAG: hypothetical protein ACMZ7B_11520 [Balneola sp.]
MRNFKLLTIWAMVLVLITGCEIPKKPDFTTSQTVEAPLLIDKQFQFLGGGGSVEVLIDTTSSDLDSLFTLDQATDLIKISIEEEFDFGDLNDAIPEISTDETSFNSQVGELEIGSFSSGNGNLGTASFQDLTGLNPAVVPAGTPIIAGSTPAPVNIDVGSSTDFFVSATIKRGSIEISITNNLGFDIDAIDIDLNSGATFVAGSTINNVNHGITSTGSIPFNQGDILSDINIDVSVSWLAQNTQATPGELIVEGINGNGLVASAVEAALESQDFSTSSTTTFDATEFSFTQLDHYVELESGIINVAPIVNGLDLTIDSLIISFPNILRGPNYLPGDSLRIRYIPGFDQILRSATSPAKERDLAGYRLYALNNEIRYNIYAVTENTQDASPTDQTRVISENDEISSSVSITNLKIAEAFGNIVAQTVSLGDDDLSNGENVFDLFNETEVELIEIDGLEDLSTQIKGLEFTSATLSINYESNIGVPTTIYGAFLGINGDGEEVYLSGKTGTNAEVQSTDPISGLNVNGLQIPADSLIKFQLETSNSGLQMFSLTFDSTNSTVNEFLNNLPSNIRFIGKAIVNEGGGEATIATPLNFDPKFSVDLPLAFLTTEEAIFRDTTETSAFEDFPKPEDNANFTDALLIISYENGLPLGFSLSLTFVDSLDQEVTLLPLDGGQYDLLGASVDPVTRFATTPSTGSLQIALTDAQLSDLYRASKIIIRSNLVTTGNEEVKFRSTDSIRLSVSAKITIENTVN